MFDLRDLRPRIFFKEIMCRSTWLAQLEEHATLDLKVVSSSLTMGVEIT